MKYSCLAYEKSMNFAKAKHEYFVTKNLGWGVKCTVNTGTARPPRCLHHDPPGDVHVHMFRQQQGRRETQDVGHARYQYVFAENEEWIGFPR